MFTTACNIGITQAAQPVVFIQQYARVESCMNGHITQRTGPDRWKPWSQPELVGYDGQTAQPASVQFVFALLS
jgi:hypothetical protein